MAGAVENAPQENTPRRVTVECPICCAQLRPEARSKARTVKCPDCDSAVHVPALRDLPDPDRLASDAYELAGLIDEEDLGPAERVRVTCPKCRVVLRAPVRDKPRRMPCPKCSAGVPIPGRQPRARAPEPPPVVFRKSPKRKKQAPTTPGLIDALGSLRFEESEGAPPRWPLVWGVFTFPWHPEVLLRWLFLSVGYATIGLLAAGVVWCVIVGGPMLRAAYAFMFPLCWITLWTISYTAACALIVIEQTANGTQEIGDWPEPHWTGWLLELAQILLPGVVAVLAAWGTGLAFKATTGAFWIPFAAAFAVVFPIVWLSSLECDSTFLPFSAPVLRSLFKFWWGWLLFYVETAVLLMLWPGLLLFGIQWDVFGAALATGPVLAAVVLIYMRLVGRLAWCITHAD